MLNLSLRLYYTAKHLLPRPLQIALRRQLVPRKLKMHADSWPIDPRTSTPPDGWTGWPEGKRFALVLTHDVESKRGYDRCLKLAELEESLGFRSSFNFVAEDYHVASELRGELERRGFEIGLHGLTHDGSLYHSRTNFLEQAVRINQILKDWDVAGFRSPCMYHNLEWLHDLNIEYDASTFDTDPFEPQPDALQTIFPVFISNAGKGRGYVELPYTLPQDLHLFVLMKETSIELWKKKLHWIVENGGLALVASHPDYMAFMDGKAGCDEYPVALYKDFLEHLSRTFDGNYWQALPREMARFWTVRYGSEQSLGKLVDVSHAGPQTLAKSSPINPLLSCSQDPEPQKPYEQPLQGSEKRHFWQLSTPHRSLHLQAHREMKMKSNEIIWVDLDNSPHVPFFRPIIEELRKRGHQVFITARDCFQVCGLADLLKLDYERVGRHFGKNTFMKISGTLLRSLELSPLVLKVKPSLAISHGSRSQLVLARALGIKSAVIMDYEHVQSLMGIYPTWVVVPDIVAASGVMSGRQNVITYPGIKEDVYAPDFKPDPSILKELNVGEEEILVTIRPPATEAHYHNPEAEELYAAAINLLGNKQNVRMLLLPRNEKQESFIRTTWPELLDNRRLIIPDHVVDGLNLIWFSDLVISGGGTMNREAAALGVPVYSIFRGKIGAVDQYLSQEGRLILLETVQDVETKILLKKRPKQRASNGNDRHVLIHLVNSLESILNSH